MRGPPETRWNARGRAAPGISGWSRGRAARTRGAGLTLLEVVITIALLTSLTLGTTMVLAALTRHSRTNRETTIANARIRGVIEKILATPFGDIVRNYPDGTVIELEDLPGGAVTVSYVDPLANPLEIRLELQWTSPDLGSVAFSFVTARTD